MNASAPVAREAQVLPDFDVRALISATRELDAESEWGGDLARIVLVLAATGARFSQIIRMTVADVQTAQRRLMIPVSRKGRGVKHATHTGVRVGDDVLADVAKATAGRKVPSLCSFVRTAADWAREVGEGRTRPLVCGGRVDAPLARNRFTGWPGRRNDPLCPPPLFDRSWPSCGPARALGRSPA